jgi:hypothetical protein
MAGSSLAVAAAAVLICLGCGPPSEAPLAILPVYVGSGSDTVPAAPWRCRMERPGGVPLEWNPTGARPWRYIVVHHSSTPEGGAAAFDALHRGKGWDEMGYHFVIDNGRGGADGAVEIGSRWRSQKWGAHCGGTADNEYNNYGIGICLVGDFTRALPTATQLESLERLVKHLMAACDIPARRVIGHREAPGNATDCPGNAFFDYFRDRLRPALANWELQEGPVAGTMSAQQVPRIPED